MCCHTATIPFREKKSSLYAKQNTMFWICFYLLHVMQPHVCWSQRHCIGKVCWICLGQILVSVLARPEATRNIFSVSGPFEIKLIPHKENLFLRGVSTAKFGYFRMSCGFPETNMPQLWPSLPLPLWVFPSPLELPAMFVKQLPDCGMGFWLTGLVPLA